jgi:hypothetical protein
VKRAFAIIPMLLPRISDPAAVQLLDILEQLLACARHHYAPQIQRWQRRHRHAEPLPHRPPSPLFDDEPF